MIFTKMSMTIYHAETKQHRLTTAFNPNSGGIMGEDMHLVQVTRFYALPDP
jgi:hypothetical protein